jgi:excisionase family DNA binding protein
MMREVSLEGRLAFSINEVAKLIGLSPSLVRRLVVGGVIPCSNVGTRGRPTYRIHKNDLEGWLQKTKGGAVPRPIKGAKPPPNRHF